MRDVRLCGTEGAPRCNEDRFAICELSFVPEACDRVDPRDGVGWCYVDAEQGVGNADLVENCPVTQRRLLRFVDLEAATPASHATVLIACEGEL